MKFLHEKRREGTQKSYEKKEKRGQIELMQKKNKRYLRGRGGDRKKSFKRKKGKVTPEQKRERSHLNRKGKGHT